MLDVEDLSVQYGTTHAVRGIDLTARLGESVAILGANGAGKSSTLRAISGLTSYTGTIRFDGTDVAGRSPEQLARAGLVHVPEGRRIFGALTVHENLQLARVGLEGRTGFHPEEVYELFEPLAELRGRPGYALSGGEQQMLAIGRALVAAPRLLLVDEPSLGLAPVIVQELRRVLEDITSRIPMLMVEQNASVALAVCSRVVVLRHGQIVLDRPTAELSGHDLLGHYLGR